MFDAGMNETTKGAFLFDAQSAAAVMAEFERHGVDLMIDLEHDSVSGPALRADSRDARGWAKLAVRNGELWAVNVTWTPDGARRLREKTQRYVSPAFNADAKSKRITSILNVAITALPATDRTPALVAASNRSTNMDPKEICKALKLAEDTAPEDVMKALSAALARLAEFEVPPPEKKDEAEAVSAIAASARRVTGKTKAFDVDAHLVALSAGHGSATELATQVATLTARALAGDLRELCRANPKKVASPKIEALVMASQSTDAARVLLDALPEVAGMSPITQREKPNESQAVTLTAEDREIAKLTATPLADILAFKKRKHAESVDAG